MSFLKMHRQITGRRKNSVELYSIPTPHAQSSHIIPFQGRAWAKRKNPWNTPYLSHSQPIRLPFREGRVHCLLLFRGMGGVWDRFGAVLIRVVFCIFNRAGKLIPARLASQSFLQRLQSPFGFGIFSMPKLRRSSYTIFPISAGGLGCKSRSLNSVPD